MDRLIVFFIFFIIIAVDAQYSLDINVRADLEKHEWSIEQRVGFKNNTNDTISRLYFYDAYSAYSSIETPLAKRLAEENKSRLYFASADEKAYIHLLGMHMAEGELQWRRMPGNTSVLEVSLPEPLSPGQQIEFNMRYISHSPHRKFTGYGYDGESVYLKNWYLFPVDYASSVRNAVYDFLEYVHTPPVSYKILWAGAGSYELESDLPVSRTDDTCFIRGKCSTPVDIVIQPVGTFRSFQMDGLRIVSDIKPSDMEVELQRQIIRRQRAYLQRKLGDYPYGKMLLTKAMLRKNPIYGLNMLPPWMNPFPKVFLWDVQVFKMMAMKYTTGISGGVLPDEYRWISGMVTYFMYDYVDDFYPEMKLAGNLHLYPVFDLYELTQVPFYTKYYLGYAYMARMKLDQSPDTPVERLSSYNRMLTVPYKMALGWKYLEEFTQRDSLTAVMRRYLRTKAENRNGERMYALLRKAGLGEYLEFFQTWTSTSRQVDCAISGVKKRNDSIRIKLKNKSDLPAPLFLYELKDGKILAKKKINAFEGKKKVCLAYHGGDTYRLGTQTSLDIRLRDNEKRIKGGIVRNLKFRWLKDLEDPSSHQIFFDPSLMYNYYDGWMPTVTFDNQGFLQKNFTYMLSPAYGIKSRSWTGWFHLKYRKYFSNSPIHGYLLGMNGALFHYKQALKYRKFSPYAVLYFRRRNLRSVRFRSLALSYTWVKRDPDSIDREHDRYSVWSLDYNYYNPDVIRNRRYHFGIEAERRFVKVHSEFRYRYLMKNKRHWDVRLFAGYFPYNATRSDYFNFGVNRPNDYLFRYRYYGRSETTGFFSRQFIMNDAGFIAEMPVSYANRWLLAGNYRISVWKWIELYSNTALVKNRSFPVHFFHDEGLHLNLVDDYLELYFPVYSSMGWEVSHADYLKRIRFVVRVDFKSLYKYWRRGVF